MSAIILHNTMSGRKEEVRPAGSPVTMYVCGPTVYGEAHVGNARPVVVFDVLYRLLLHEHGAVAYARNITDIDDRIIATAKQEGVEVDALARKYTKAFRAAATALGNLEPTYEPRATECIDAMIKLAGELIAKGHAYVADGHVLFAVATFADYGQLANRTRDAMIAGARVEVASYKRDPGDFVLWKPAAPEQPGWDSPWGRGRPGWHLECSAMIRTCLGETIDIHGGGNDLAFPHHENEIAQSRCALGTTTLAHHWVHNGHVTVAGSKMAKSTGNHFLLSEALTEYPGEVIRYALLAAHYRSPLDWSLEALRAARAALTRLYRALSSGAADGLTTDNVPDEFMVALKDDLNTPRALSLLHEYAVSANRATGAEKVRSCGQLAAAGRFLGLLSTDPHTWLGPDLAAVDTARIEALLAERASARQAHDFKRADELRQQIEDQGVVIEDGAAGTSWRSK